MIKQEVEELGVKVTFIDLGELIVDDANSNQEEILSQIEKVLYSNNFLSLILCSFKFFEVFSIAVWSRA